MRYTITILAAALLMGAWVAPAAAQRRDGPPDPETRIERMTERLDLTERQADRVRDILREQATARQRIFAEQDRGPETRERMMELRERTHQRLAEVLTEEQMQRMKRMRRAGPAKRPCGRSAPMRGRRGGRG